MYDITQPASGLLQAMQRYDEGHSHGATTHTDESTDGTGSPELDRFLRGKDNHRQVSRCDTGATEVTIAAVQQIARSMAGFSGRKSIVWVTEHLGLPLEWDNAFSFVGGRFCGFGSEDSVLLIEDPANLAPFETVRRPLALEFSHTNTKQMGRSTGASTYLRDRGLTEYDELDLMLRLLNKNNISLYPVSAEGLQTVRLFGSFGMDGTVSVVPDPSGITNRVLTAEEAVSNQRTHQAMERLAGHTGGRALHDRNDIETGIRRALGDAENGYELAYYPDHDHWNGDWHKIQVKVNRSGVVVLARAGYYAFPDAPVLLPKARKQLLTEIAASPLEDTEIPITVQMNSPSEASPPVLQPRVYLSANDLFHRQSDGWQSNFGVLFFQLTAANAILDVTTQNASVELTDANYTEALKRGIKTSETLELKPGAALLYVIVHDKTSDSVGSVRIPLGEYTAAMQRTGLRR